MNRLYIGLMSGTSLDGVDAVLAAGGSRRLRRVAAAHLPIAARLRGRLLALNLSGHDELHRSALLANELAALYARAALGLLRRAGVGRRDVAAIGCHGQTIRHRPELGYTLQLVNGALLAELTGMTVVTDFRARDVAAGGEGAPLAPAFHRACFHHARKNRAILNVGGFANLTCLPARGRVTGFDCGPGNSLLDAWIHACRGAPYDRNGAWAARGRVDRRLLGRLLAHPFFRRPPPKSTGRDMLNLAWVERALKGTERAVDVQATLLELTAAAIAQAVQAHGPRLEELYVCGGGARNGALMARLAVLLPRTRVATTQALGIAPEHVEALAFAWLARAALQRAPGNVPSVTGARAGRVLGAIYPA
jgi:anhydro-N-acetylmuramic acid kinase